MIALFGILSLLAAASGDFRVRAEQSWPDPVGITDNLWQGSNLSFYERLCLDFGLWSTVLITEKDPGEEWGDLITGGVSYTGQSGFKAAAGGLRVQFAHGLVFSHPGPWSAADPLSLSKTPSWRMRTDLSESPGTDDAESLTGATAEYSVSNVVITAVLGWSALDSGSSGLHRTESEIENKRAIDEKLAVVRAGFGPVGISFAHVVQSEDTTEESFSRIGSDFLLETKDAVLTGEIATDFDSTFNFLVSGSRGQPELRHALTVSRNAGNWPRGGGGTNHRIGAGYGLSWRPVEGVTIDAGALVLDKEEEDSFSAALQVSERVANRTSLTQRIKITATEEERTYRAQVSATWSPYSDLTLSLKVPATWYQSQNSQDENGTGIEVRLKHSPVSMLDITVSAAAGSTNGWNSRIYAYSLSFPGEFGSRALYNSSVLLQGAVSLHISESAILRMKSAWYNMEGAEFLGSGSSETEGSSRTSAGIQLDWKF